MKESDRLERRTTLNVNYAPRVEVGPFNPLMIMSGSDAIMTCTAKANPPIVSFEWYKEDKIISNHQNHTIINVGPSDSGTYTCVANNGIKPNNDQLDKKGRLELRVQYSPNVKLVSNYEANIGESVKISCTVDSEPRPYSIVWTKEDDLNSQQIISSGEVLKLDDVGPFDAGRYQCVARNKIKPSGSNFEIEKSGKSSVTVRVKHAPGSTSIVPVDPVAVAGRPYTLTCSVKPPGYPLPKYRWWKQGQEGQELGTGQNHTFLSVHATHEGKYYCQPYNDIGQGSTASVYLTVREPPSIIIKMPPQFRKKQGDKGFSLTCKARAKPRPSVIWLHNGQEVNTDSGLYRIDTREEKEDKDIYNVQSTLYFESASRSELTAEDRGKYECVFDNEVGYPAKSETYLRIEHSPILQHTYNKVAFDAGETAVLECKMSAFPEPRFEWFFGSKPLGLEARYIQNLTEQPNDLWIGALVVRDVRASDYGDYTCRAWNSVGDDDKKTNIRLVTKSAPEMPRRLEVIEILSDSVTLRWAEGFNGGFADTEFLVTFSDDGHRWRNESCRTMNPCKILGLESRREYRFRVMAINPRGQSMFSEEMRAQTKVNLADIPTASEGYFDPTDNLLAFRVEHSNSLKLIARIEHYDGNSWTLITTAKVRSELETIRLSQPTNGGYGDMRVILCLQSNDSWCGYPLHVKTDVNSTYLREARSMSMDYVLTIMFILIAIGSVGLILFCCCCKKRGDVKKTDCDNSDNNRNKVSSISPPYYSGHDNKALVNGSDDSNKISPPPMYSSNMNSGNGHIPQNYYLTGDDAVVPSPSGTNETVHSDAWMMKNDHMNDVLDSAVMGYHSNYGTTAVDPNAFSYAYYPGTDEYQPLSNDGYNINVKNSLYSPCYNDSLNGYGTTPRSNLMNDNLMDSQMLSQMDVSKINHLSFDEELSYGGSAGGSRSGKMIKEIIV